MGKESKGRTGIRLLRRKRKNRVMPDKILSIIEPEICKILRLLWSILEASKQYNVVLVICHAMTTSCRRRFAFGFHPGPFSSWRFETPELGKNKLGLEICGIWQWHCLHHCNGRRSLAWENWIPLRTDICPQHYHHDTTHAQIVVEGYWAMLLDAIRLDWSSRRRDH